MTNVDRVKAILGSVTSRFSTRDVKIEGLNGKQIGDALRSIKFVKNLGNGKFKVKGRKVI